MTNEPHAFGRLEYRASFPSEGFECFWLHRIDDCAREVGTVNGPQSAEQEAYASLFVASPDLLTALREAVHLFEAGGLAARQLPGRPTAASDWFFSARAAIAKASVEKREARS